MLRQRLFHPGPAQLGHGDALLGGQLLEAAVVAVRQLHDEAAQPFLGRGRQAGRALLDVGLDVSDLTSLAQLAVLSISIFRVDLNFHAMRLERLWRRCRISQGQGLFLPALQGGRLMRL